MKSYQFPIHAVPLTRIAVVLLFLAIQIMVPLNGAIHAVHAAPARDPQPAPVMEVGMPRPRADENAPLELRKEIDGGVTTAEVGDEIHYRIRYQCSDLEEPCGAVVITDVLDPYLKYIPANSHAGGGFSINYDAGSHSITLTNPNMLDGSQGDAVIAVQVAYNTRPLPYDLNNTVTGTMDRGAGPIAATSKSAPTIVVQPAAIPPDWYMTKTLYRPSVNPTLDTDVTYEVKLCPSFNEGNAALHNIVITDTLPLGASFVSASHTGSLSGTGDAYVWDEIPGPIFPPDCVTRYITLRYVSVDEGGTFELGDTIQNLVSATAEYYDNDSNEQGPIGIDGSDIDISHPIAPIAEEPTYSKANQGDPIGLNGGTGRFILSLDTNSTNYPSNDLVLIDDLPEELEVTSVTSGTWGAAFDYVRARIEYSTDGGSNYSLLGTVDHDDDMTYNAPETDITNVKWIFEYDPDEEAPFDYTKAGLPYSWAFSKKPEIRVTPRVSGSLAHAVADGVYTNCLKVNRTDSGGASDLGDCEEASITVRGDFVSLDVSKRETPGIAWDEWDNPTIEPFTSDNDLKPGDTLRYVISVEVTERSSAPLIDPTIQDQLPSGLIFVRSGKAYVDGTELTGSEVPNFVQSGQTLTWSWNDDGSGVNQPRALTVNQESLKSHTLTVEFFARIPRGQSHGNYTNNLYVVTDSVDARCENVARTDDDENIDQDAQSPDWACKPNDVYTVDYTAALRGEKWIRSVDEENAEVVDKDTFLPPASPETCPDGGTVGLTNIPTNPFTRYPCISQAYPEGALSLNSGQHVPPPTPPGNPDLDNFEYNIRIFNDGNAPMVDYVLYDILPYVGDTGSGGALSSDTRKSEFRPSLRGAVKWISGPVTEENFTIDYNTTTNPCRPEVFDEVSGAIPSGCDNTWYAEADVLAGTISWDDVRSYRIRLNSGGSIPPTASINEVRFGVPMYIPADSPVLGSFNADDAQALEIAWNSFSHVGSYVDLSSDTRDLLASEPRKVGITVPERMSVGNRVWRDADNSGTINPPDDKDPGIADVVVELYREDGTLIATTTTDSEGYYLFSNILHDTAIPANNNYYVKIPARNFEADPDGTGVPGPLYELRSSTGEGALPSNTDYVNPSTNTDDSKDDGIDPSPPEGGGEVVSAVFTLTPSSEPEEETDLSDNADHGLAGARRGVNGETDNNSDLTVDFGFFGGSDVPFSIGNHVWFDNGAGATSGVDHINNGIFDADESGVEGARVELYRDGNLNGSLETSELIRFDVTDANGFYLFDNLDPGNYYVKIAAGNFADGHFDPVTQGTAVTDPVPVLQGWFSSQVTAPVEPASGVANDSVDSDDNGIDINLPHSSGVTSSVVILKRGENEPAGETHLSGDTTDKGLTHNPTAWDGDGSLNGGDASIGRFGEIDESSNITVDFGFIPPMSIGNRVWFDSGKVGTSIDFDQFNDGIMNGDEAGVGTVRVVLINSGGTVIDTTDTDSSGYYLFDRVQPGNYTVKVISSNFGAGGALLNYVSSFGVGVTPPALVDQADADDNGIDDDAPATNGISSAQFEMAYGDEPDNESDLPNLIDARTHEDNVGAYGQTETNSNLTLDFGFVQPRSLGNRVWFDTNNDGILNNSEQPIKDVTVSLYLDQDGNGEPDSAAIRTDTTDTNGYYLFDNLIPERYIVVVDASNFDDSTDALYGYYSSTNRDTSDDDSRDNGFDTLYTDGIRSATIDLRTDNSAIEGEIDVSNDAGDGAPNYIGNYGETDSNSDITIDFGFYKVEIGNLVYSDDNADGTYVAGDDTPLDGVTVRLYAADGSTEILVGSDGILNTADDGIGGVTTASNGWGSGEYLFSNLPAGDYIIKVTTPSGLVSTIDSFDQNDSNDPDYGTDNNDNGVGIGYDTRGGQEVPSNLLTVNGGESIAPAVSYNNNTGITTDNSLDFGFTYAYALGNRVWYDTDNSALMDNGEGDDGAGTKVGVDGVLVKLYMWNATTSAYVDTGLTDITANGGYYLFDYLTAGDYIVVIPEDNFRDVSAEVAGTPLAGYWSSTTVMNADGTLSEGQAPFSPATDPDDNADSDDNGTLETTVSDPFEGDVISQAITLGLTGGTEPDTETDVDALEVGVDNQGLQDNNRANMTVDFGFYKTEIGNFVFNDKDRNGIFAGSDVPISDVTMRLFSQNGTEIAVGADGIFGTTDDATANVLTDVQTDLSGLYKFSGLPAGNYIVKATTPAGFASTTDGDFNTLADVNDPDNNINNNDNGVGTDDGDANRLVSSSATDPLEMVAGEAGAQGQNIVDDGSGTQGIDYGTTYDPTVDFGFHAVVSIGSTVFADHNNNGLQEIGDLGINGVVVELYLSTQTPGTDTPIATDTTDTNGDYYFDNLLVGNYIIYIPTPPATAPQSSTPTNILDDNVDGDDNGSQSASGGPVTSPVISLTVDGEPTDAAETYQGNTQDNIDDDNGDMTVDFGFFPLASQVSLGSTVFADTDDSGVQDAGELGIGGVDVELYLSTQTPGTDTAIATDTTDTNGDYLFENLPAGDYIVYIPTPPAHAPRSSTPTDTLDNNEDGDDNGSQSVSGGPVTSPVINLTVDDEPTETNTYQGYDQDNSDDDNGDMTVDFGFIPTVSIGSYVWLDANRDGIQDSTEVGVDGAELTLLVDNGSGTFVPATDTKGDPVSSITTGANGLYHFTLLPEGDYRVRITPPTGYTPTPTQIGTDNDDNENDSNINLTATGLPASVYESGTFTLSVGGESHEVGTFEGDTQDDSNELSGNMTVDFGFNPYSLTVEKDDELTVVAPGSELTYTITVTNAGGEDLTDLTITDTLPAEVDFVSASDGGTESGGVVTWQHSDLQPLPGADPSVLAPGETKTVTLTVRVKDNPDIPATTTEITNSITVEDSATGTTDNDDDTDTLVRTNTKALIDTNHAPTTYPEVTIGEILTYRINLVVPAEITLTNLSAKDVLDTGLAFVECQTLTATDLTSTRSNGIIGACPPGGSAANPDPAVSNGGHNITFTFGNVTNNNATEDRTLSLEYDVVVLDIAENTNGVDEINNLVTWSWDGGELSDEALPVEIVEPDMDIEKTTELTTATLGTTIPFTLEVSHTAASSAHAYDVVITDELPTGLEYVDGSVSQPVGALPFDSFTYDPATTTLTFVWDYFPLLATTTVNFEAIFIGPPPVLNEASVVWTSLEIDPSDSDYVQSEYNDDSTERWYDPTDQTGVDDYGVSSSIQIDIPRLPSTGFAPNRITPLPRQTAANAYENLGESWLEIPKLGLTLPIVGVPLRSEGWDLTWLDDQAGYLEGTAYPGLPGNTALTAHVYLPDGSPGPFVDLHTLLWGDKVILHANGQRYIYQIRTQRKVWANDLSVLTHEAYDWVTLITCQGYNEVEDTYTYRIAVRAVLLDVQPE